MPKLVFKLSDTQSLDFPLAGDHVRLGRNAANDIVIDNSWISSFHAEFRLHPDGVTEVRDLHSTNGTTVNGQRIESARLSPGDTVGFGQLEATFDPVPENLSGPNGSASRTVKPAEALPPPGEFKGARLAKLSRIPRAPETQAVHPLPRAATTEPVPSASLSNRLATPAALPAPTAMPVGEMPADVRRELQKAHAELAGVRSELKSLADQVETLRRDRESEEQSQAQIRLQGEREARELRTRLEKLQEEIEKSETAAADSAKARNETLSEDEKELTTRLAGLKSTSEASATAIKAQEERLAALKNEEAGLAAVSAKLHSAMHEAVELGNRNAAASAAIAGAENRFAALQQEIAEHQKTAETARSDEAGATTAAAVAVLNLEQLQAQTAAAADLLTAREAELAALLRQSDVSRGEAEAGVSRQAEQEKATVAAAEGLAALTAETAALSERRAALDSQIKTAETQFAEQNAKLKASGDTLRELESAQSRLAEIEAAIADSTAKAKIAADAAKADEKRKGAVAMELAAAKEEHQQLTAAVSKAAEEFARLEGQREKTSAELTGLTNSVAERSATLKEACARLEALEQSIADTAGRLAEAHAGADALQKATQERQSLLTGGEAEAAAIAQRIEAVRRELANRESAVSEFEQRKACLTDEVEALATQKAELTAAKSSLKAISEQLTEANAAIAQRQAQLAKLDMETSAAAAAAVRARETQTEAMRVAKEVAENQQKLAALVTDISIMAEKRAGVSRLIADTTAQFESLTQQMAAARAETEALEQLRAEAVTLKARSDELDQKVRHLEDRKQTFAAAPDANWGTVHAMSKGIIKQVDLLDDLIQHHVTNNGPRESIEQMSIFRAGLADILVEYNVEPYRFEPGFTVDVSARKKIQIVESREVSGEGTRIEKTWRPGYICTNGALGVQTLLRKAEVSIVIGK